MVCEAEARNSASDLEDFEGEPFVANNASPSRWSPRFIVGFVVSVALIAMVSICVLARPFSEGGAPSAAQPLAAMEFNELPAGEQVDFYIFTHVGNPKILPDILKYPLEDLVNSDDSKGILVMYVMHGNMFAILLDHINTLAKAPNTPLPEKLVTLHNTCRKHMETANTNMKPVSRIRMLTPFDFKDSLLSIRLRLGEEQFQEWFGHTTYDAPKFADALLRLRSFGNDVPVFRFDIDVLFNKYTKSDISSIKTAVSHGVADFNQCVKDPFVQSFLVSQQYSAVQASRSQDFNAWNEAYSTRANPALLATPGTTDTSQWKADGGWGNFRPTPEVLQKATDEDVMMAFYGLQKVDGQDMLQPTTPSSAESPAQRAAEDILKLGNAYIGANPSRAVISGAALAVGPGVSVDMPPFLHTDLNIMWIDDHLFDRLTQEVTGTKRYPRPPGVGTARVVKARSQPFNLAKYTLEIYMPTLMYGILMDAWVNNHTSSYLLKYAPTDIPKTDAIEKVYGELVAPKAQGPWSRAFEKVRETGNYLSDVDVQQVKKDLWSASCERAKDTYWQWSKLPQPSVDGKQVATFATLWGTGRICKNEHLKSYCTNAGYNKLGRGLVTPEWDDQAKQAKSRKDLPTLDRSSINPVLAEKIDQLIEASLSHLRWTLTWPDVVQAIRDEMVGLVPSDVSWHNPPPMPQLGA